MHIRPEQETDIAALRALISAAFATARHASGTEAQIVDALRTTGQLHLSLVAQAEGAVVGHVAFSPVWIEGHAPGWFGLGPVAVLPAHQGRGIGSALIRQGVSMLRNQGAAGCVVLGDPAYYRRFGFVQGALWYPGAPEGCFMQQPFRTTAPDGRVTYAPAFGSA